MSRIRIRVQTDGENQERKRVPNRRLNKEKLIESNYRIITSKRFGK